jgi:TPR repeat protein
MVDRNDEALPAGTLINGYEIKSVLGAGGFGITYLGEHRRLGKAFAIKEYFPRGFARRTAREVSALTAAEPTYKWGLDRFIDEARALAKFHHRSIVAVSDVFEANGTAYIVLAYEIGQDMRQWQAELQRPPTQGELDRILGDLLDALAQLHAVGLLHRDIAPDNIFIREDGSPVLLDFGSARHALGGHSAQMSAIVKNGFSPPEQYTTDARVQGAWTDIYAMGATLYVMLTGSRPPEAASRMLNESYVPLAGLAPAGYRKEFLEAIDQALRLAPRDRPQSVILWTRQLLLGSSEPLGLAKSRRVSVVEPEPEANSRFLSGQTREVGGLVVDRSYVGFAVLAVICLSALGALAFLRPLPADTSEAALAVVRCDELAGIPEDPARKAGGVMLEAIDAPAAVAACQRALTNAGTADVDRMRTQLSRAQRAAGNFGEGYRALRPAVDAGYPEARVLYGDYLYFGTPPAAFDRREACSLYEQAMRQGSINGLSSHAYCVATGQGGLSRDEGRAATLYRQAADAGSREAMLLLGILYRDGHGVGRDSRLAVSWIEKAAGLGEARANYVLADIFHTGYGVEFDRGRATTLYRRARSGLERMAMRGHIDATTVLGSMHRDGNGMGADPAEAVRYYKISVELGNDYAMGLLADLYARGTGVIQDLPGAMQLLQTAVARADDNAMLNLGILHEEALGTPQNDGEALKWYRAAAERGSGAAMERIASLYFAGRGVKLDYTEALSWYRRAGHRGIPSAINSVGVLTERGDGTAVDFAEARRLYELAAGLGNVDAMRNLGHLYETGRGVARNGREAQTWFLRAVERNDDAESMHRLGELFRNGTGIPVDYSSALQWYRRAVEKDFGESIAALGIMYDEGQGVTQNFVEAARLYRRAADKGSGTAMYQLGSLYERGRGVVTDCRQARDWYTKSAGAGDEDAKAKLADKTILRC